MTAAAALTSATFTVGAVGADVVLIVVVTDFLFYTIFFGFLLADEEAAAAWALPPLPPRILVFLADIA